MNSKYIADIKFNGVMELSKTDIDNQDMLEQLANEVEVLFKKYGLQFNNYETMIINKKKYSIAECEECGNITVNRDKNPLGINEKCFYDFVYDGGISNNKLLCEICLPSEHRWS